MKQLFISKNQRSLLKTLLSIFLFSLSMSLLAQTEVETAKNYLRQNTEKHKIAASDIDRMLVSNSYLSPTTGWYHVYFNQAYQSIKVYNSLMNLVIKDGQVQYATGSFVSNIAAMATSGPITLTPVQALQKAAQEVNMPISGLIQIKELSSIPLPNGSPGKVVLQAESLSDGNIIVEKYWLPYEAKSGGKTLPKVVLTWNVRFLTKDLQNSWNIHINAQTGDVVQKQDDVIHCNFGMLHRTGAPHDCAIEHSPARTNGVLAIKTAMSPDKTYNVFDYPLEAPTFGGRTLVTAPYTKFVPTGTGPAGASNTNGWHFDGTTNYNYTRGNNVWAQDDANNDNGTSGSQTTSATLDFDFPYSQGLATAVGNRNAAITNLFYWNNLIHDVLWKYGFDEPSGNFQNSNQGRGGEGNDFIYADAQDGGGSNNANFFTPIDGMNGRMQMYLWNNTGGYQPDGDFDNGIIAHEYGHGWSTRLTGGPNNSNCLANAEQGGEGWSDYLTLMLTTNWSSLTPTEASGNIPRGIGTYVLGQPTTGAGIRPYRYAYFNANPNTVNAAVTYAGVNNAATFSLPHGIGSIWATMLWDMTWEIILQDAGVVGANAIVNNIYNTPANIMDMRGNLAALKIVNEGLRLQPCSPSFVQARDAILTADRLLFGGRYRCAIGKAFARRGLGADASTGVSSNDRIVIEDFKPISGASLSSPVTNTACSNQIFNYTATSTSVGTAFSWTRAAVAGISNAAGTGNSPTISETLINTTSVPVTVKYLFSLNAADNCPGSVIPQPVNVVVSPSLVATVPAYSICQNVPVPVGQGLKAPAILINTLNDELSPSDTYTRGQGNNTTIYTAEPGAQSHYKAITFVAPSTAAVTFEVTSAALYQSDAYMTLYQNSFNPYSPATNFLRGTDDIGGGNYLPRFTHNLTAGTTYVLVVAAYYNDDAGIFTVQSSPAVFPTGPTNWYLNSSGGVALASGDVFNPVGVAGSGIPTTATPGSYTFYAASPLLPDCRTATTFTINPAHSITLTSATATETQAVCMNSPITSITYSLGGGATGASVLGLPTGVTGSVSAGLLTISGSPITLAGSPFSYSITTTGTTTGNACGSATKSGTITVTAANTAGTASSTPTLCINTALVPITRTTTGATGIGTPTGLPAGVTAVWNANTLTLSGTPTAAGLFNYSIPLTGGCGTVSATGTITVTAANTAGTASSTPTLSINTALVPITRTTTGATGIGTPTGLPASVTASQADNTNTLTLSGNSTAAGLFNYSIPLTADGLAFATVMPNPVTNTLYLKVQNVKDQNVKVTLMDAAGRSMIERRFIPQTNQHQEEFEVSDLANGIYFLWVNANEKNAVLKVLKIQ